MLSIIITCLNEDNNILNYTIDSIFKTTDEKIEIIVIDDCSDIPVIIKNKNVILERNTFRIGVAQSRHSGASLASNPWLLFTDAHMIFYKDWLNNFIEYKKNAKDKIVYNGTSLGLWADDNIDYKNIDLDKLPKYHGARLSLYDAKEHEILEGKWITEKIGKDNYNISCLMGAIYFIQKKYFFELRGLSDLKMWGSDEPCLSLKVLSSGGEIRQLKNVRVAHLFRRVAPYKTASKYTIYNKIRMAKTLLPENLGRLLISKLPQTTEFFEAIKLINNEHKFIQEYKNYYDSIFTRNINDIASEFNINIPNE